jgi:hypothetical protein
MEPYALLRQLFFRNRVATEYSDSSWGCCDGFDKLAGMGRGFGCSGEPRGTALSLRPPADDSLFQNSPGRGRSLRQ